MADKSYVVSSYGVLVNLDNGQSIQIQRGAVVPKNADQEQVEHMLSLGLITEGAVVGGLEPLYAGDGSTLPAVEVDEPEHARGRRPAAAKADD